MNRRDLIWAFGGFAVGAGLTTAAAFSYRAYRRRAFRASLPPPPPPSSFSSGQRDSVWILSKEDRSELERANFELSSPSLEIVLNADLPGPTLVLNRVNTVQDCIAECEEDTACTRFTFAKMSHPEPNKRRVCWLKTGDGSIEANGDTDYISGWRR